MSASRYAFQERRVRRLCLPSIHFVCRLLALAVMIHTRNMCAVFLSASPPLNALSLAGPHSNSKVVRVPDCLLSDSRIWLSSRRVPTPLTLSDVSLPAREPDESRPRARRIAGFANAGQPGPVPGLLRARQIFRNEAGLSSAQAL